MASFFPGLTPPPATASAPANEAISGDSLTQFIRSLQNYLENQGSASYGYGQQLTGQAAGGLNTANTTLQPSTDYWTKLLSGDPATMANAVAPTANAINTQFDTQARQAAMSGPRGGYQATNLANLPWQKAATIGGLYQSLQPQAAAGLSQNAGIQGSLAQILGQLGLGTSQLGAGLSNDAANLALGRRGQNVAQSNAALGAASSLGGSAMNLAGSIYNTNAQYSDKRLKEKIKPTKSGLETILKIPVHDYNFKGDTMRKTGFIAQELAKVHPSATIPGDEHRPWMVAMNEMVPVLTRAIQQQHERIKVLEGGGKK